MYNHTHTQSFRTNNYPTNRKQRVWQELRYHGASYFAIHTEEGQFLPHIIHDGEHIGGVAYGWNKGNFAMLVATNRRVIYLDKKPLFIDQDEIAYNVVSGVNFGTVGLGATVILHTRVKDYKLFTFNEGSAREFIKFIEARAVEQEPALT